MNPITWLQALAKSLIPVIQKTIFRPVHEPASTLPSMDVDKIYRILRGAECGDTSDLFALYRDIISSHSHLLAEFLKRKMAVLGTPLNVKPGNKDIPADVETAAAVEAMIEGTPDWIRACSHLLDSALYPVSVVEKVYEAVPGGYRLARLVPVPYELLDYTMCQGELRIRDTDPETGSPLGSVHFPDPNRYIIHRGHLMTTLDQWGGPMRTLVYWWLFSTMSREWWVRMLDRFGAPFIVGRYDSSDEGSRRVLTQALSLATKIGGLVVSRETEIELQQINSSQAGDAFDLFRDAANMEMSKLIVGQTLSASAQSTGLGSGVANMQQEVREDIQQFDGMLLAQTLRDNLVTQFCHINNLPGAVPKLLWGQAKDVAALLERLSKAGLQVTDRALSVISERLGIEIERAAPPPSPLGLPGMLPPGKAAPLPLSAPQAWPTLLALAAQSTVTSGTPHEQAQAAVDAIARAGAADLAQAFRGSLAPIRDIILTSHSADECEQRISAWYARFRPGKAVPILEDALSAYAYNGAIVNNR